MFWRTSSTRSSGSASIRYCSQCGLSSCSGLYRWILTVRDRSGGTVEVVSFGMGVEVRIGRRGVAGSAGPGPRLAELVFADFERILRDLLAVLLDHDDVHVLVVQPRLTLIDPVDEAVLEE